MSKAGQALPLSSEVKNKEAITLHLFLYIRTDVSALHITAGFRECCPAFSQDLFVG
jgi:hypothetical protein